MLLNWALGSLLVGENPLYEHFYSVHHCGIFALVLVCFHIHCLCLPVDRLFPSWHFQQLPPLDRTPLVLCDLITKIHRSINFCSTKWCLVPNNASNHLILLIFYIQCSLIQCLAIVECFKILKKDLAQSGIFSCSQPHWLKWTCYNLRSFEMLLQYVHAIGKWMTW